MSKVDANGGQIIAGPTLFTIYGHSYCPFPNPSGLYDGKVVSYRQFVKSPKGVVWRSPFIPFSLTPRKVFSAWVRLKCPPAYIFDRGFLDDKLILRLKELSKSHGIKAGDFATLVVMERLSRKA